METAGLRVVKRKRKFSSPPSVLFQFGKRLSLKGGLHSLKRKNTQLDDGVSVTSVLRSYKISQDKT